MTQVIHHLTPDTHGKAYENIGRVLKPGGTFWIQTCTPHQALSGMWWTQLIPNAASRCAERMTPLPVFEAQLETAGLSFINSEASDELLIPEEVYWDANGPFDENYRKSDSTWTLASEEELQAGLKWWKRMIENGQAEKILNDCKTVRNVIGQTTSITSQKN